MADSKIHPTPAMHLCPVCHCPQTKIQRKLGDDKHGATNYVCARSSDCVLGINLANVETWVVV
jgi:ssDNA-binding Zn-finger/Zn-ribbon topoisomerase 1